MKCPLEAMRNGTGMLVCVCAFVRAFALQSGCAQHVCVRACVCVCCGGLLCVLVWTQQL